MLTHCPVLHADSLPCPPCCYTVMCLHVVARKYVGLQTRADLFGYRHGTKSEVDSLNMVRQGYEKTIGPVSDSCSHIHLL